MHAVQYILYTVRTRYSYGKETAYSSVYTPHALVVCSIRRPPKWLERMREAPEGLPVLMCSQSSIWKPVCDCARAVNEQTPFKQCGTCHLTQTSWQPHRRKPIMKRDFFFNADIRGGIFMWFCEKGTANNMPT